ncbi:MAG TPA: hypothetical protein VNH64_05145 [Parvularculaceae bacterium]|nr:hypothetical protein [Parvularculaceae bacterium]
MADRPIIFALALGLALLLGIAVVRGRKRPGKCAQPKVRTQEAKAGDDEETA